MDFKQIIVIVVSVWIASIMAACVFGKEPNSAFKRMIFSAFLAFVGMSAYTFFFGPFAVQPLQGVKGGDVISVSAATEYSTPVNYDISLERGDKDDLFERVDALDHTLFFSTQGAVLANYEFYKKTIQNDDAQKINISYHSLDKTQQPFFVALNVSTPLTYRLVKREEDSTSALLVFEAENEYAQIRKEFIISKKDYWIDFSLSIHPKKGEIQARVFMPAPLDVSEKSDNGAFIVNEKSKFIRMQVKESQPRVSIRPPMVGAQGVYFLNAFVQGESVLGRRSYVVHAKDGRSVAVLESANVVDNSVWNVRAYVGPREYHALKSADERLVQALEYGMFSRLSGFLLRVLDWIGSFTKNYGIAVIILALLIRLVFLPFSLMSRGSTAKREEFARKHKYISERYKDDPERRALEQAELVKKYGILPGGAGCVPVLGQLPFILALQSILRGSITFYHEPFILWIKDLSMPDPYRILPACLAIALYAQLSRTLKPTQKLAALIASVAMLALLSRLPAGVVLFGLISAALGILQMSLLKV